jgi:hypothetical protein
MLAAFLDGDIASSYLPQAQVGGLAPRTPGQAISLSTTFCLVTLTPATVTYVGSCLNLCNKPR